MSKANAVENIGTVRSLQDYVGRIQGVLQQTSEDYKFFCRGQPSARKRLRPSIGRYTYGGCLDELLPSEVPNWKRKFAKMFDRFEREYIAYYPRELTRHIDRLSLAQHYGLPTQLLDWTTNPLAALYFACECKSREDEQEDGIVFFMPLAQSPALHSDEDVRGCRDFGVIRPIMFDQRMVNQQSVFTYHVNPVADFGNDQSKHITAVLVEASSKRKIMTQLECVGFHQSFIYPGLSRVCNIIKSHHVGNTFDQDKSGSSQHAKDYLNDDREPYIKAEPVPTPES